jgi:hypothetical protein
MPELEITLVGGCLTDSTTLFFGVGGANYQRVFNTGLLTDHNFADYGFEIDGQNDAFWNSGYWFAVSERRIANNITESSTTGRWLSWQADPNWCDNQCKPALQTAVPLGEISTDGGATYTPISGNMVCAASVDSVQNFDDGGGGWDWGNLTAPFDPDSTMGLSINHRTVGALDIPELANVTVTVYEFTERNGNDIPGWKFGGWSDTDAGVIYGGGDTIILDNEYSMCWDASVLGEGPAFGWIKIPYGCMANMDGGKLKNVVTLDSDNSMYADDYGYWDSLYIYSSRPVGEYSMPNVIAARDQSMHATIYEKDILANETFSMGVVLFGYADFGGATIPVTPGDGIPALQNLSDLVNKWAGFGRGDVNNDRAVNLADVIYLADYVNSGGNGPYPFMHTGDVDADGDVDAADVDYLINFYFCSGDCPMGAWVF